MNAKATDLARVQEMFNLIIETQGQMERLDITEQRFKNPVTDADRLFAEGIMNRVFRVTEEAGSLSDEALKRYDFGRRAIKGVRNRLAHAYSEVNADIIWEVVQDDFPKLIEGCQAYCDDLGLELEAPIEFEGPSTSAPASVACGPSPEDALAAGLPAELLARLEERYDASTVARILAGYASARATTLRVNALKTDAAAVASALDAQGLAWRTPAFYRDAFILGPACEDAVRSLGLYERGGIYLQSLSAMLPALALAPQAGENILDMAAAPGGKTCQIAALAGGKALVTACEKNAVRAEKLRYNLEKQGVPRCNVMQCDARKLDPFFTFDKVLLDAPCSGSGTVSLAGGTYRGGFTDDLLARSVKTQRVLLQRALLTVRPGGTVVYATCSILPDENEKLVESVIDPAKAVSVRAPRQEKGRKGKGKGKGRKGRGAARADIALEVASEFAAAHVRAEVEPLPDDLLRGVPLLPCALEGAATVMPTAQYEGFFLCVLKRTA